MSSKESGTVRYAYGVAMALLVGGTAFSIAGGPVGAQVAQNAPAALAPRAGAPMSFAELSAHVRFTCVFDAVAAVSAEGAAGADGAVAVATFE